MKKIFKYILIGAVIVGGTSCKKYLDINDNPNSPTESTPNLILPQAIVGAASMTNTYNLNLADQGGQRANAGGFGGFGEVVTYQYTNDSYASLWTSVYNNAKDFQYVIKQTEGNAAMANYSAIAKIMKAFDFSKLVDQFNDVPYSEAFQGAELNFTPTYDKGPDVYKSLVTLLNEAITQINDAKAAEAATPRSITTVVSSSDPMYGGNMDNWIKFANTLKLKMLVKMAGVPDLQSFTTPEFAKLPTTPASYITEDATVNPGYSIQEGKRNPTYNNLAYLANGNRPITSRIATKWMLSFYGNPTAGTAKITDPFRSRAIYQGATATSLTSVRSNQLGDESSSVPTAPSAATAWYSGGTSSNEDAIGVAKGASQAQPILILAEAKFLQAEAALRNYIVIGSDAALFNEGVTASFRYLYKNSKGSVDASKIFLWQVNGVTDQSRSLAGDVTQYQTLNATNYLVNYNLATSFEQRLEAIITQKYIALNMISNDEALSEFRRTAYPRIVEGSLVPTATFASRQSTSPRPDKLTTRALYPQSEFNLNPANVPSGISQFTSRIFWDLN
jgi:hypothetical protein